MYTPSAAIDRRDSTVCSPSSGVCTTTLSNDDRQRDQHRKGKQHEQLRARILVHVPADVDQHHTGEHHAACGERRDRDMWHLASLILHAPHLVGRLQWPRHTAHTAGSRASRNVRTRATAYSVATADATRWPPSLARDPTFEHAREHGRVVVHLVVRRVHKRDGFAARSLRKLGERRPRGLDTQLAL